MRTSGILLAVSSLPLLFPSIKNCVKFIVCDAFISHKSLEMVSRLRNLETTEFRQNLYLPTKREVHHYTTSSEFIAKKGDKEMKEVTVTGDKKLKEKLE
jgi:hypothetical protein